MVAAANLVNRATGSTIFFTRKPLASPNWGMCNSSWRLATDRSVSEAESAGIGLSTTAKVLEAIWQVMPPSARWRSTAHGDLGGSAAQRRRELAKADVLWTDMASQLCPGLVRVRSDLGGRRRAVSSPAAAFEKWQRVSKQC